MADVPFFEKRMYTTTADLSFCVHIKFILFSSRRVWTPSESKALLERYTVRKGELVHNRKKRLGYANMLKDLKALGVLVSTT